MRRALTGLRTAVGTLTVLPMGVFDADPRAAVPWYPWVGFAFSGAAVGVAAAFGSSVEGPLGSLLVGTVIAVTWAILSGGMHLDALADTADAIAGGATPEERLAIMRDSSVGALGAAALVFVVLLQVICLAVVFSSRDWWALAAAPVLGRATATLGVTFVRPARGEGLGASACGGSKPLALLSATAAVCATLACALPRPEARDAVHAALAVLGLVLGYTTARSLAAPAGGCTGDTIGASVLYVETAVLFAAACLAVVSAGWPL